MRTSRAPFALALVVSTTMLLSGCSVLSDILGDDQPVRGEDGEIVQAADADAFALRVGDCLNALEVFGDEAVEVETVPTVPCGDVHDGEVYATSQITARTFPGDDAVMAEADEFCYAEFSTFVGLPYEDSELDFTMLYPSKASWQLMNDREIACIVVDLDADATGSMKGAQR